MGKIRQENEPMGLKVPSCFLWVDRTKSPGSPEEPGSKDRRILNFILRLRTGLPSRQPLRSNTPSGRPQGPGVSPGPFG